MISHMDESTPHHLDSGRPTGDSPTVTSIDAPARRSMFKALFVVVLLEPIAAIVLLAVFGVPWWIIGMVMVLIVTIPALVLWIIHLAVWRPLMRRHPAQPIHSGAVSKSFQSIAFGPLMRLNNCVTLVADDEHLHVEPFAPMKWVGSRRISLLWSRMKRVKHSQLSGMTKVEIDNRTVTGPEWCMKLAPDPDGNTTIPS